MARPKKRDELNVGGKFEAALVVAFGNLSRDAGVSMREALRRVMTQAIIDKRIPGISALDLESHEREKWGAVTPTLDDEGLRAPSEAALESPERHER